MLSGWFSTNTKQPCKYKFEVKKTTENILPNVEDEKDEIINKFAYYLLVSHGDPGKIKQDYNILIEDLQTLDLIILRQYVESHILPGNTSSLEKITRIGNFGEILATQILIEFEKFWLPLYKLRFREKRSWAMKLTDLCLIKTEGLEKPLVCYGEVKTKSSSCNFRLGVEGHDSLVKDDALENSEILSFFSNILFTMGKYEEAEFLQKIQLGKIDFDRQHFLFIVHEKSTWDEKILANLNEHNLSPHLIDFSVNVVLVNQLRKVIDESYSRAWKCVDGIVNE